MTIASMFAACRSEVVHLGKSIARLLQWVIVIFAVFVLLPKAWVALTGSETRQAAVESGERDRLLAALERIRANYVDEVDESELVTAAINGMIGGRDSESEYLDWETFRDAQTIFHGRLAGLGLEGL